MLKDDTGYLHDGRADKDSYRHDGGADKDSYPHAGRADKDSYPRDRHNQYIMLSLYLWLSFSINKLEYSEVSIIEKLPLEKNHTYLIIFLRI